MLSQPCFHFGMLIILVNKSGSSYGIEIWPIVGQSLL